MASEEQGLAGGLVITSFQFGGALVLAVVTALNDAVGSDSSPQDVLNGFHAALVVPLIVAIIGVAVTAIGAVRRPQALPVLEPEEDAIIPAAVGQ